MFCKTSWFVAAGMMTVVAASGCRSTRPELPHYPATDAPGPSAAAMYPAAELAPAATEEQWACPMHPQIRQSTPGKCSLCGMDLVRSAQLPAAGESSSGSGHSHSGSGHANSLESGHSHGCGSGCSGCG